MKTHWEKSTVISIEEFQVSKVTLEISLIVERLEVRKYMNTKSCYDRYFE